ncbi:hypothetical protein EYZ11_012780 [Aspergillus tanneri]|uniref:Uncharacterized protein n=1 Tax=Aspergillus tanneri TaxID=1220188 RepID=A0A4S3IZD2_9EURO|nr:hypothetical protein EYZ11_012780 [Aspergillus tanneri]
MNSPSLLRDLVLLLTSIKEYMYAKLPEPYSEHFHRLIVEIWPSTYGEDISTAV